MRIDWRGCKLKVRVEWCQLTIMLHHITIPTLTNNSDQRCHFLHISSDYFICQASRVTVMRSRDARVGLPFYKQICPRLNVLHTSQVISVMTNETSVFPAELHNKLKLSLTGCWSPAWISHRSGYLIILAAEWGTEIVELYLIVLSAYRYLWLLFEAVTGSDLHFCSQCQPCSQKL